VHGPHRGGVPPLSPSPSPSRLRDRLLTRRVARAATSPSGLLAAGAGVAAGALVGLPLPGAVGVGVVAWAVRVAVAAAARRRPGVVVDPFALPEPWRGFVREALQARARFVHVVEGAAPGPLQERLRALARRVDDGVQACWRVARRGAELDDALAHLDEGALRAELARVEAQQPAPGSPLEGTAAALRAQLASAERLRRRAADAAATLRLLDARLGDAVARVVELTARGAGEPAALGGLGDDVDGVVGELEALRAALDEAGPGGEPGPVP